MIERLETDANRDEKRTIVFFLHQKRRHRSTKRNPQKVQASGEKVLLEQEAELGGDISLGESVRIRRVFCGTLRVSITSLNRDANMATNVDSDTLRLMGSPEKSRRELVEKDQLPHCRSLYHWVVCLKILIRENLCNGKREIWDQITPSVSPRARGTTWKLGKERVHRQATFRSVNLTSAIRALPDVRKERKTKPCTRKDARVAWDLAKNVFFSSKNTDKAAFYSSIDGRAMPAPTSKPPEEREWGTGNSVEIQDFQNGGNGQWRRANKRGSAGIRLRSWSLHDSAITRRHACSSITWQTLRTRIYLWVGQRSKATLDQTREEDSLHGKISYLLLSLECRQFLVPARLLHRYRRTHQARLQVQQQSEVTMEHQENWRDTRKTQNKNKKRDNDGAAGNRLRDLPEWSKGFTENLEDTEVPAPAHISHHADSERPTKVASRKYSIYTHFPEDRNCEVCKRTKMTRAPCKGRTGEAVPRAEKFGDLITADHKVLNEEGEPRNNHRYAVVVQDLATQWIHIRAKTKKYFQETEKSFTKVPRAVTKAESHWHWQFNGIWQILCRSIMESSNFYTSSIWDEWYSWTSGTQNKRRELLLYCCDGAWMEKWWADSMECHCYLQNVQDLLARWEKLLLEGDSEKPPFVRRFREPFEDPGIPFGAMVECHPSCARDQSRFNQVGRTVLPGRFLGYALTGEVGKEMFWSQTLKSRRPWTSWTSVLVESKQKKYRRHKGEKIS